MDYVLVQRTWNQWNTVCLRLPWCRCNWVQHGFCPWNVRNDRKTTPPASGDVGSPMSDNTSYGSWIEMKLWRGHTNHSPTCMCESMTVETWIALEEITIRILATFQWYPDSSSQIYGGIWRPALGPRHNAFPQINPTPNPRFQSQSHENGGWVLRFPK